MRIAQNAATLPRRRRGWEGIYHEGLTAARARSAYVAFIAFIFAVYSSPGQWFPALAPLAPGKVLIALAGLALAWSVLLCGRRLRSGIGAGGLAVYFFGALIILSPLWSLWPRLSIDAAGESIKYLAAFFLAANVLDTPLRIRRGVAALALASLFPAVGALHSKLTGAHIVEETRAAWIGVFGNPNFLAYHLVVATPLALALRESVPRGARHAAAQRIAWLAVVGVFAAAILVTESRGGALGLGAVLLLWLLRGLARGRVAIGAACAVAIAVATAPGGPWSRADTKATLAGEVNMSAQGRLDAWRTAVNIVEARPLGGVGAGAFFLGYELYAPGDAGPPLTAHNSFVMVAAELGLPALTVFVAALAAAFLVLGSVASTGPPATRPLARGTQTALFGFLVCSMTGGYAFTWPLYLLLGTAAAMRWRGGR